MEKAFRKTGIDIIGDAPWGTHLCQFYETREDLVDILVPYFKAGLENNEFCMWITSEPLKVEDAKAALKKVVKNLDHFIKKGQIEILDYSEWYTKSGKFDANNVLRGWVEKENQALKRGYDGLRLSGNTFWLAKRDWRNFTDYEEEVNNVISKYRMIAICTYSLGQCGASEVIDVISNHQFALIRREGKWVIVESSERKRTEDALRESEEEYRSLFEESRDTIYITSEEGKLTDINQAGLELLGYTKEELIGLNVQHTYIDPNERAKFQQEIERKGFVRDFEIKLRKKDGTEMDCLLTSTLRQAIDGGILGYQGIIRDITERKRAEKELMEKEMFNLALFEYNPIQTVAVDLEGKVTGFNLAKKRSGDRLPNIGDVMYKDYAGMHEIDMYAELMKCMRSGEEKEFQEQKYGDKVLSITISPFPKGAVIISEDITERKHAEEALLFTRFSVDNSADTMAWVDHDARLVDVNDAFCRISGYSREELLSKTVHDIDPDYSAEVWPEFWKKLKQSGSLTFESYHRTKEGKVFPVEVTANFLEYKGKEYHCSVVRNITERKRAQDEIKRRNDELLALNAIAATLNSSLDLQEILDQGLDKMLEVTGLEAGSVYLLDQKTEDLVLATYRGVSEEYADQVRTFKMGESLAGKVAQTGEPIVVDDLTRAPGVTTTLVTKEKICSFAGVPIKSKERVQGVMNVASHQYHPFSPEEIRLYTIIAGQMGVAIENARLYGKVWQELDERKRAEEALRENEVRYRNLVESISDVVYTIDGSGVFTYISPVVKNTLGYEPDELIGRQFLEFVHKEDHDLLMRRFSELGDGIVRHSDYRVIGKQGDIKWVRTLTNPIIEEGGFVGARGVLIDITERKQVEEALHQSEENFKALAENANDGILVAMGEEGWHVYANRRAVEIFGYPIEELFKTRMRDLAHPDELPKLTEIYEKRLMGLEVSKSYETAVVNKDGIEVPIEVSASKTIWQNQIADLVIVRDITERKKAEEALRESKEFVENLIASMQDGFSVLDNHGVHIDVNPAFCQMTGFSRKEIIGVGSPHPYWPPEAYEEIETAFQKTLRGEFGDVELTFMRKNGERFPVIVSPSWVKDKQNNVISYFATVKDITERKRAEEALTQAEEKYRSIFENVIEGIFQTTPEGRFLTVNPVLARIYGYSSPEEMIETITDIGRQVYVNPGERLEFLRTLQEKGTITGFELQLKRKDGSTFWASINARAVYDENGNILYHEGTSENITERKRAEGALRRSEERFRASVETLLEGFAILSAVRDSNGQLIDFKYEYINEIGCKMNQKAREEHIGRTLLKLFPEEKEIGLFDDYVEVIETGQPLVKEHVIYEPVYGGSDRLKQAFDVRISRLEDGIVVTWQDITEKKRREELLRQSEERLKRLVENSKDIIVMADLEGGVLYYNGPPEYGVRTEDVLGKNAFSIFEPVIAARLMNQLRRIVKEEKALTIESLIPWRGEPFWFSIHMYPIQDEQNRMYAVGVIARNITERKRMEEDLSKIVQHLTAHMDNSPLAVVEFDSHFRVTRWSKGAERVFGWTPEEIVGKSIPEMRWVYDEDEELVRQESASLLSGERSRSLNVNRNYRKDSSVIYCEWYNSGIYDSQGKLISILSLVLDITNRKRTEEALRESEGRFRCVFDTMVEGMIFISPDGEIIQANPAAEHILGLQRSEIDARNYIAPEWEVFRPDGTPMPSEEMAGPSAMKQRRLVKDVVMGVKRPDRSISWINVSAAPLINRTGDLEGVVGTFSDITERKQAEEALKKSTQLLRDTGEMAKVGGWELDLSTKEVSWTEEVGRIHGVESGYKPKLEEAMNFYAPESRPDVEAVVKKAAETGEPYDLESLFIPSGSKDKIWVRSLGRAVYSGGKIVKLTGTFQNIDKYKRAEEALRVSLEKYRVLFESFPLGITISDKSGKIIEGNRQSEQLLGITREEHAQRRIDSKEWQIIRKDGTPMPADEYASTRALRENRLIENVEMGIVKDKGQITWINVTAAPMPLEGYGVALAYGDITERKRVEEALRRAEENFRRSLDESPLGVRIVTTEGETVYANRAILDIYGYDSIEELRTTPTKKRYTPESYAEFQIRKKKRQQGEYDPPEYGISIVRKNGEVRHLQVFRKEVLWNGEKQYQAIYLDITERKRSEEQLRTSRDQLHSLSAHLQSIREEERTLISREIHDELGQELTGLKMDLSWLIRKLSKNQKSLISKTESMLKLVDNTIQTVRRISSELRPGVLDDLGLIAAIEWQAQDFENRTGITCDFSSSLEEIGLDRDRSTAVFRIFEETLTNVFRHAKATRVKISLEESADSLILRIEDNGKGIKESEVSNPKSLGLLGMRERVLVFGGKVEISGIPKKGTTVVVTIPINKE